MTATSLQLISNDDLQTLKQNDQKILELLEKRPEQLFQLRWIESKKVPALLDISPRTWQSWRDKRIIPYSQFGAKIYVKLDDINALLEKNKIETLKAV
jgi:hypothetical protein